MIDRCRKFVVNIEEYIKRIVKYIIPTNIRLSKKRLALIKSIIKNFVNYILLMFVIIIGIFSKLFIEGEKRTILLIPEFG